MSKILILTIVYFMLQGYILHSCFKQYQEAEIFRSFSKNVYSFLLEKGLMDQFHQWNREKHFLLVNKIEVCDDDITIEQIMEGMKKEMSSNESPERVGLTVKDSEDIGLKRNDEL